MPYNAIHYKCKRCHKNAKIYLEKKLLLKVLLWNIILFS